MWARRGKFCILNLKHEEWSKNQQTNEPTDEQTHTNQLYDRMKKQINKQIVQTNEGID